MSEGWEENYFYERHAFMENYRDLSIKIAEVQKVQNRIVVLLWICLITQCSP